MTSKEMRPDQAQRLRDRAATRNDAIQALRENEDAIRAEEAKTVRLRALREEKEAADRAAAEAEAEAALPPPKTKAKRSRKAPAAKPAKTG